MVWDGLGYGGAPSGGQPLPRPVGLPPPTSNPPEDYGLRYDSVSWPRPLAPPAERPPQRDQRTTWIIVLASLLAVEIVVIIVLLVS